MPLDSGSLAGLGFPDDALRNTVARGLGAGADADATDKARFQRGVVKLIRRRRARHGDEAETIPAAFFLTGPPGVLAQHARREIPMLDNGRTRLGKRLWFVGPTCASGVLHNLTEWDDAAVFNLAIDSLGIGDAPAIIFDPRDGHLDARWYVDGLRERDRYEPLRVGGEAVDITDIIESISRIHKHSLRTPSALGRGRKAWQDHKKFWVAAEAEHVIEACLQSSLQEAFPSCVVRKEQETPVGRSDLEIHESHFDDLGTSTCHAILELKVLRTRNSGGNAVSDAKNDKDVRDGVIQADEYRKHKSARAAALCCFDMRQTHQPCFGHVETLARRRGVRLAAWPLFNDAKSYRQAQAAGP